MVREHIPEIIFRIVMTVSLFGCFVVRVVRAAADWGEVAHYYQFDSSLIWFPVFATPFLVIIATAVSLWLRQGKAVFLLALISFCISGFFVFGEGLTVFARLMNANYGYVGAEPLLSIVVCAVAGGSALLSRPN